MYFLQMSYRNARHAGTGDLRINRSGGRIAKWTLLDEGPGGLELLRLISAACGGTEVIPRLNFDLRKLCLDSDHPLQVELALGLFAPYEVGHKEQGPAITGVRINSQGELTALKKSEFELLHAEGRLKKAKAGIGSSAFFLLSYGCRSTCHNGADDFDFGNPYFRLKRIHSLFERNALLTDPIEFLTRLHYRGIRWKRSATGGALERLSSLFRQELNVDSSGWLERDCDFKREWKKLSRFFKDQGKRVFLARHEARLAGAECVYASGIFSMPSTLNRLSKQQRYYGDALIAGGTGIDVSLRLPPEVESFPADYSLYPELGDRAIGFLTRGCPFRCPFCVVPAKEGDVRQVCDLDDLMTKGRRKLILLDDNILSHAKATVFLEEMARRKLAVNFNQTLDIRFVDRDIAKLLLRIQCSNVRFTRRVFHFSLKDNLDLDGMRRKYDLFGFTPRDNVEFVCMYGYDTNLAQDVERFRFLRSLPGAYVFVQPYRPPPGGRPANLAKFLDERAAASIDELIRINFPQNMKSMENYYRWVSKLYAQKFGRPPHDSCRHYLQIQPAGAAGPLPGRPLQWPSQRTERPVICSRILMSIP
jgi:hypothetical protein